MSHATDAGEEARPTGARFKLILAGLMTVSALSSMEGNIVATALPTIASDLNGLSHLSWVITGFMLAQSSAMPLFGKISDMYGRKPLFMVAIALFIVGSGLCAIAQDMLQLILFRGIQGAGAAGIMTLSSATMADLVSPRERGRYQGLFMAVFAMSSLAGPPLGGLMTTAWGWRSVFYINVPLGLLVMAMLIFVLPRSNKRTQHRIDFAGAGLLITTTTTLLLTLTWGGLDYPWLSPQIAGLMVLTAVLAWLLYKREQVAAEPILPLHIFKDRTVTLCAATTALVAFPFFGAVIFLPLYFQMAMGMSPAQAGSMTIAQIGGLLVASTIGGFIVSHTGRYKLFIVAGVVMLSVGLGTIGLCATLHAPPWLFLVSLAALGIGGGLCMPNFTVAVQNAVQNKDLGSATAIMTFANTLAGAAGAASAGAIMAGRLKAYVSERLPHLDADAVLAGGLKAMADMPAAARQVIIDAHGHAVSATFLTGSVVMLLALGVSLFLPSGKLRGKDEPLLAMEA